MVEGADGIFIIGMAFIALFIFLVGSVAVPILLWKLWRAQQVIVKEQKRQADLLDTIVVATNREQSSSTALSATP